MKTFAGKRVLLLQGPIGPFFGRLACDLQSAGAVVCKVNFNGGDWLFSPRGSVNFRGDIEGWPEFLETLLVERSIDMVFLFGDCRRIHGIAREVALKRGITVGVFEEGYIRPDYITLEEYGVNGYSPLPRTPDFYLKVPAQEDRPAAALGNAFRHAALYAILYYLAAAAARPLFRHYRHHRPLSPLEALPWLMALWRKVYYAIKERGAGKFLAASLSGRYFLVPLQVYIDGQVRVHSEFGSVTEFIGHTLASFARHAPAGTHLIFKHHPLDRGYNDYGELIGGLAREHGIGGRVMYVHDLHLPTLLSHARGVVVINSTVGLSAIHHGTPVKACGRAVYDMKGLTYQGSIDAFWKEARAAVPDNGLYLKFRDYVIEHSQLNGNYYKRLGNSRLRSGIDWQNVDSKICPGRRERNPFGRRAGGAVPSVPA